MPQRTKSKLGKHLTAILKEMCRRIDVPFESVDFDDDQWYRGHSWTREQEAAFEDWLVNHMASNIEVRCEILENPHSKSKKSLRGAAQMFCFMWGWSLSD